MSKADNSIVMNNNGDLTFPPQFDSVGEHRRYLKERLVAAFRLFGRFGFDEGVAGHITARDPERSDCFWVNPFGRSFKQIKVSDLILVDDAGNVVEGQGLLNGAAFTIHSHIHKARPDAVAAAHAHSLYGKAWSSLGRKLDPITQDSCAFFQDHGVFESFTGVVLDSKEGELIAEALGDKKACILQNHGLLTVGDSVEATAWWFITMERSCQAQLLAEAAGTPKIIAAEYAQSAYDTVGSNLAGWFSFKPLFDWISAAEPEMFE